MLDIIITIIIISFIKSSISVITKMHNLSKLITKPKPTNVAALFSFMISFFLWSYLTLILDMAPFLKNADLKHSSHLNFV